MDSSLNTINFSALTQDEKNTQILNAARNGSTAVVAKLIAAKANIEATEKLDYTALMLAEIKNHQNSAFLILRAMSPASRGAVKFGQGGCALNRRLAARYEAMASDFERKVCEMYQFFKHSSRPMVNPVLTIMLEYLQSEWLLNSNMEAEIRLASRTVRRQERLAIKAPVPVTFRYSASAEQRKEEGPSSEKNKRNGNISRIDFNFPN